MTLILPPAAPVAPSSLTATPSAAGGLMPSGTFYYVVTALGSGGESLRSNEASAVVVGPTGSVALAWTAVPGAVVYKLYRSTVSGQESVYYVSATNSYTDTYGASSAGGPPSVAAPGVTSLAARDSNGYPQPLSFGPNGGLLTEPVNTANVAVPAGVDTNNTSHVLSQQQLVPGNAPLTVNSNVTPVVTSIISPANAVAPGIKVWIKLIGAASLAGQTILVSVQEQLANGNDYGTVLDSTIVPIIPADAAANTLFGFEVRPGVSAANLGVTTGKFAAAGGYARIAAAVGMMLRFSFLLGTVASGTNPTIAVSYLLTR